MIEDVGGMAKLLSEYGPYIVILAVFLVIFLTIIVYILHANKKIIENEREMTNKLVTSFLNDYFSKNSKVLTNEEPKQYDEKNIVDIYMRLNKALKNACEETLKKTGSNRTAIYVFHNGSHASHGLPFFKMSCISEKVSKDSNVNIKMADHSAMPLSLFDSIVASLYNNSNYRIVIDKATDPGDLIFLKGTKLKECFFVPIFDDEDNMMGFIFNGYNNINPNRDIEKEKECLTDLESNAKPDIEFLRFKDYKVSKKE